MRTEEEVKEIVIESLENLIEEIKTNDNAYDYTFSWDIVEREINPICTIDHEEFKVTRYNIIPKE